MDIFKVLQKLTGDSHGIKTNKNLVEKTIHRGVPAATSLRLYNGTLWDDNEVHMLKRTNSHGSSNSGGDASPPLDVGSRDNSMELVELSLIWTPMKDLAGHSGYAIVTLIM